MLRGGSDHEITATSEVMEMALTFSGGWLGTAGGVDEEHNQQEGGDSGMKEPCPTLAAPTRTLLCCWKPSGTQCCASNTRFSSSWASGVGVNPQGGCFPVRGEWESWLDAR